ncbi:MAG: ATP synthase F1 subunit gamma [Patescibacteria group bacterium]|nr:ATP synthase F1 subunit gamma [Patescibacteria group bacterium]MDE2437911.1 ATP synthase F1 subunit gamma [Patescibacteria group bacterium]
MPSTKLVKQRIRSVKNTAQITKAMEVVSATKMRHAQEFALRARPYAIASLEMLRGLLLKTTDLPDLLREHSRVNAKLILVVTSDKGLAGSLNANVLRKADAWIRECRIRNTPFIILAVGKKAKEYADRQQGSLCGAFVGFGDVATLFETSPIADMIVQGFEAESWGTCDVVYTHFRTTLSQEAVLRRVLPVTRAGIEEIVRGILPEHGKYAELPHGDLAVSRYAFEYAYEPSPHEILDWLVPELLRMHVHHIILESNASEHSARMVAMKHATDNAKELVSDLTLTYNKVRQAGITRELTEITAGREALENNY